MSLELGKGGLGLNRGLELKKFGLNLKTETSVKTTYFTPVNIIITFSFFVLLYFWYGKFSENGGNVYDIPSFFTELFVDVPEIEKINKQHVKDVLKKIYDARLAFSENDLAEHNHVYNILDRIRTKKMCELDYEEAIVLFKSVVGDGPATDLVQILSNAEPDLALRILAVAYVESGMKWGIQNQALVANMNSDGKTIMTRGSNTGIDKGAFQIHEKSFELTLDKYSKSLEYGIEFCNKLGIMVDANISKPQEEIIGWIGYIIRQRGGVNTLESLAKPGLSESDLNKLISTIIQGGFAGGRVVRNNGVEEEVPGIGSKVYYILMQYTANLFWSKSNLSADLLNTSVGNRLIAKNTGEMSFFGNSIARGMATSMEVHHVAIEGHDILNHPLGFRSYDDVREFANLNPRVKSFVIHTGTNSLDRWELNIEYIKKYIVWLRQYGIQPVLSTVMYSKQIPYAENIYFINKEIRDLGIAYNIPVIEYSAYSSVIEKSSDQIHPSPSGYKKMVELTLEYQKE